MGEPVILIADDSRMIRRILVDNLSNYGYRVIESENGDVALTLTLEHHPDLIISDINMPIMDGFDFCWSVKKTEAIRHIPFIFLTTRDEISDKVRGRNLGAAEYVNKPFDMETSPSSHSTASRKTSQSL
jgi:putative two-component system response regulator